MSEKTDETDLPSPVESELRGWRYWIRPLVALIYAAVLLVALPLLSVDLYENSAKPHTLAWFVAGIFVVMTVPLSLWTILHHLIYFTSPELQKPIIRILWMVPIYAIDSWIALRFTEVAIYFDTIRECYEAYVIYNFMIYLLNYLSQEYELAGTLGNKPQQKHIFPFCCMPSWPNGGILIQRCQQGVLQYTLIRPVTTLIALICELTGTYHEGDFSPQYAYLWILIINNLSQIWSLYCLVIFYMATKEELKPIHPVGKFICVKAIVFATFWQSMALAVLVQVITFNPIWGWNTKEQFANGMQDLLICFEMFIAAIAHYYSFTHKPYVTVDHNVPWYRSIKTMFDVSDIRSDVSEHVSRVGNQVKAPWSRGGSNSSSGRGLSSSSPSTSGSCTSPPDERSTLLGNNSQAESSDGELANILGYGSGPYTASGRRNKAFQKPSISNSSSYENFMNDDEGRESS